MNYIVVNKLITKSIYKQIAESIASAIDQNVLKYNDKLPTEKEICQMFSISQTAVKMAYEQLILDGKIKRIKGKGTYVTNRKTFHSKLNNLHLLELNPDVSKHVLLMEKSNKDFSVMRALDLSQDEKYYHISSTFSKDNNTTLLQRAYIPMKKFKGIESELEQFDNIYDLIDHVYGYDIKQLHSTFSAYNVSPSEALILGVQSDDAVYLVKTKVIGKDDEVLGYLHNLYPGEFTEIEVEVHAID